MDENQRLKFSFNVTFRKKQVNVGHHVGGNTEEFSILDGSLFAEFNEEGAGINMAASWANRKCKNAHRKLRLVNKGG
jgi:hypothetical protein